MPRIWKEVLCQGRWRDARKRWFTIAPSDIKDAHKNARKMLARGLSVPCVWEHQNIEVGDEPSGTDIAEWKRNYARYTFGHIVDSRVNERGNLDLLHEVPDPQDAAQLVKTRFCSPKVYPSFSDSRGGEYTGCTVAHVASTPTPVQHTQKPFAFEFSSAAAPYLAYTPPEKNFPATRKTPSRPVYGESFTEWLDGLDLSALDPKEGNTVADKADDTDMDNDDDAGGGMAGDLKMLVKALKARGINVSDKVGTLKELIIAVESNGDAEMDEPEPEPEPADTAANADAATTDAGGPPMVMSTLDANPVRKRRAVNAAKPERDSAAKEIKALFERGMMTPSEFNQLNRQNAAFEMSFTADLAPAGKWLKVRTKLDEVRARKKRVWTATASDAKELSATDTADVDAPASLLGKGVTPERAQLGCDIILGKKTVHDA